MKDDDDDAAHVAAGDPASATPGVVRELHRFVGLQRELASMQREASRAAAAATDPVRDAIAAACRNAAAGMRSSVDMAGFQAVFAETKLRAAREAHRQLAVDVARIVNVTAMRASGDAITRALESQAGVSRRMAAIVEDARLTIPRIELPVWLVEELLTTYRPENLRTCERLDEVARIAVEEGLPLAWVPRAEIVSALLDAGSAEQRVELLIVRADDVLDDCRRLLAGQKGEWALQCGEAIECFAAGFDAPAQSHASNIIDSIVRRAVPGRHGAAMGVAARDFADVAVRLLREHLVLCPLSLVFVKWYPGSGAPPPEHFARHATAHAVGHPGLFSRQYALIAVMAASSMARQFSDEDPSLLP